MEAILLQGGETAAQVTALIVGFYFMSKRIDRVEKFIDTKINNGITTRINAMGEDIARIQGRFAELPKRKSDAD